MAPRVPPIEGIENYLAPKDLSVAKVGRPGGAMPPQISGENIEETPSLPADGKRVKDLSFTTESRQDREFKYEEPPIPHSGTVNSSIWNTRFGGAYIEVSGKKGIPEFINIVHTSGTRISLDSNGGMTIKSMGDTHNITDGNMFEVSKGMKTQIHRSGYTLHIQDGVLDLRSEGNLNLTSANDINITAGGKLNMNIGDAIDIAGERLALTSRVESIDLVANTKMRLHSFEDMSLKCEGGNIRVETDGDTNIKSEGDMFVETDGKQNYKSASDIAMVSEGEISQKASNDYLVQAGSKISLKAGTIVAADPVIQMSNAETISASVAEGADVALDGKLAGVPSEIQKKPYSQNTTSASPPTGGIEVEGDGSSGGGEA